MATTENWGIPVTMDRLYRAIASEVMSKQEYARLMGDARDECQRLHEDLVLIANYLDSALNYADAGRLAAAIRTGHVQEFFEPNLDEEAPAAE